MSYRGIFVLNLLLLCCANRGPAAPAHADISRAVIESGKSATALVKTAVGMGTAFCIGSDGYFVTSRHILADNKSVTLILNPGQQDQKTTIAAVVQSDPILDLALLHVEGVTALHALPLASNSATLVETTHVVEFGFLYDKRMPFLPDQYPAMTVRTGRISALRKDRGVLSEIQTDLAFVPGCSGGALMDESGKVIAVVQTSVPGANFSIATPENLVRGFLLEPHITMLSAAIPRSNLHVPASIRFRVAPWNGRPYPYQVTFTLAPHTDLARSIPVQPKGDSTYGVTTVLSPLPALPEDVQLIVANPQGAFAATTKDREIVVGGVITHLRTVASIFNGSRPSVHLRSGRVLSGAISGLTDLPVILRGVPAKLNLSKGQTITILEPRTSPLSLQYEVTVRSGGIKVGQLAGALQFAEDPNHPVGERVEVMVPSPHAETEWHRPLAFRAPIVLPIPGMNGAMGLCLADIDHDGHLDIVVTAGTDLVVIYGQGDVLNFNMLRYPMGEAGGPIRIADMNRDGRLDVIVGGNRGAQVLLNIGARRFSASHSYATGQGQSCITVGDFNSDGFPDIASINMGASKIAVLLNRGDGTFDPAVTYPTPAQEVGIVAADLNGDGNADLALNCLDTPSTILFLGDGHGHFRQSGIIPLTGGGQLFAADLNRDGHTDLIGLNYLNHEVGVAISDGKGDFLGARQGTVKYPSDIDVGDVDGDGLPDVAFGCAQTNLFTICLNGGNGQMKAGLSFTVPDRDIHSAVIGDLNEDGLKDIVTNGGKDRLFLFVNHENYVPGQIVILGTHELPLDVPCYRFEGNGHDYCTIRPGKRLLWTQANRIANSYSYKGRRGRLVTILSREESEFITAHFPSPPGNSLYIGALQNTTSAYYKEPNGGWEWAYGKLWEYTNWGANRPNDRAGKANYISLNPDGTWSDCADGDAAGFIIEFQ